MSHRPALAAFAALLFAGATAIASAATQEFDIKVPVTVKALSTAQSLTVFCAVGGANMAYSTATGDATNSTGKGSTRVQYSPTGPTPMDVVVVVTDQGTTGPAGSGAGAGKGPLRNYLCWGKFEGITTPVNFISGAIK
jgi:hypothetical protein